MKVVILAGGFGTRISEESQFKPKPMIEIGGKPCLLYTSTTAKMLWDDEYLYVGAVLQEEDIKARLTQRDTCLLYTSRCV